MMILLGLQKADHYASLDLSINNKCWFYVETKRHNYFVTFCYYGDETISLW